MDTYNWYATLIKPSFAPPSWVFGPVWTVLYMIIAVTFGYVGYLYFKGKIPFMVLLPFLLNIVFNFAFTPIQFGLRNNFLAMIDILLTVATLVWALVAIYPFVPMIVFANIPYALWATFATVLQITITKLNWK